MDDAPSATVRIRKEPGRLRPPPHLVDYAAACASFRWEDERRTTLDRLPHGRGVNMAHEAVDRHLLHGRGGKTALRWIGRGGARLDLSFAGLAADTSRFANALRQWSNQGSTDRACIAAAEFPCPVASPSVGRDIAAVLPLPDRQVRSDRDMSGQAGSRDPARADRCSTALAHPGDRR